MSHAVFQSRSLRLCRIVTTPFTFGTALREQIGYIVNSGIDLTLVSSPAPELDAIAHEFPVRCQPIMMLRRSAPRHDLQSLWTLTKFFATNQFDIIHSSTPKAGLLVAIAGRFVGVPIRIHTYTGQVWVEMKSPARELMRGMDWLIGVLNTHTYADSFSQREFLIQERLVNSHKISVLGYGSISGVDLNRFDPVKLAPHRALIRRQLKITEEALIIVFVGRVTRDKGIVELIDAFEQLRRRHVDLHLVLVGPRELERDPLLTNILDSLSGNASIHFVGFTSQPEAYLAAADIFCLPSYREGFGSVVIEAAAMNLPTVATAVAGLVDAVVDGETGLLVPSKNIDALVHALEEMITSPEMRQRLGQAARARAVSKFDARIVNQAVVDEYFRLARSK